MTYAAVRSTGDQNRDDAVALAEAREALVRHHLESSERRDVATTQPTFVVPRYELVPSGEIYQGREAVSGFYEATREAFPDQRNEVASVHHAGDTLIVEFDVIGTHLGEFRGLAPTGKPFTCRMVALFSFDDLEVTSERVYFDTATILRQLGGEPAEAPAPASDPGA